MLFRSLKGCLFGGGIRTSLSSDWTTVSKGLLVGSPGLITPAFTQLDRSVSRRSPLGLSPEWHSKQCFSSNGRILDSKKALSTARSSSWASQTDCDTSRGKPQVIRQVIVTKRAACAEAQPMRQREISSRDRELPKRSFGMEGTDHPKGFEPDQESLQLSITLPEFPCCMTSKPFSNSV